MPHPQSVLDIRIAEFRQDFYDALAAMEAHTYDHSTRDAPGGGLAGVGEYQPFWQAYNAAVLSYLDGSIGKQSMADFLLGLFCFLFNFIARGRGPQALHDASNAAAIFRLDGLVDDVLSRPVDYYDDYTFDDADPMNILAEAPRLEADTQRAGEAWEPDLAAFNNLKGQYGAEVAAGSVKDVYEGAEPPAQSFGSKAAWDEVFTTLNWAWAFGVFDVGLDMPQRPPDPEPDGGGE
ncbi:MAG: hypothetical protein JJU06_13210 [Ectothiorhodospiraceae bacterium]|nr:hypothetical protein [Ectothiorhodospiraceae bacterium]